jgi:hypothetical protein
LRSRILTPCPLVCIIWKSRTVKDQSIPRSHIESTTSVLVSTGLMVQSPQFLPVAVELRSR